MRKILPILCLLAIVASAVPVFAEDSSTVSLTPLQLEKLNTIQSDNTALIAKIDELTATYKGKKKARGLLSALKQYRKQAVKLNKRMDYLKAHPITYKNGTLNTHANWVKIKNFKYQEKILQKKVAKKAKLLAKIKKAKKNKKT